MQRPFKIFQAQNRGILQKSMQQLKLPAGNMIIEHFADGNLLYRQKNPFEVNKYLIQSTFQIQII